MPRDADRGIGALDDVRIRGVQDRAHPATLEAQELRAGLLELIRDEAIDERGVIGQEVVEREALRLAHDRDEQRPVAVAERSRELAERPADVVRRDRHAPERHCPGGQQRPHDGGDPGRCGGR